mgnify:FL=1
MFVKLVLTFAIQVLLMSGVMMVAARYVRAKKDDFINVLSVTAVGMLVLAVIGFIFPNAWFLHIIAAVVVIFIMGQYIGVDPDMFFVFLVMVVAIQVLIGFAIQLIGIA